MPSSLSPTSIHVWSACPAVSANSTLQRTRQPQLESTCCLSMHKHTRAMMSTRSSSDKWQKVPVQSEGAAAAVGQEFSLTSC